MENTSTSKLANIIAEEAEIFDLAEDALIIVDQNGRITFWNQGAEKLYGWTKEEIAGNDYRILLHSQAKSLIGQIEKRANQRGHWSGELAHCKRDGSTIIVSSNWTIKYNEAREPQSLLQINRNITAQKRREKELMHQAFYDTLTDLPNRALFMDRLDRVVAHAKRQRDYKFAILFLDLDHFKEINDLHGHIVGDQLLAGMGKRFLQCTRENDTVARLGGDEFAILLNDLKVDTDATYVAERIQQQLEEPFKIGDKLIKGSVSIGIGLSTENYDLSEDILHNADTALYRAKRLGRGRFEISAVTQG